MSFSARTHTNIYTHRMLSTHADTYLTDSLPGGKPHERGREEEQGGEERMKKRGRAGEVEAKFGVETEKEGKVRKRSKATSGGKENKKIIILKTG